MSDLLTFLESIGHFLHSANFFLSGVSLLINIFHLMVLTRITMRTSSTNVMMIGIAISDMSVMMTTIYKHYLLVDVVSPECTTSNSRFKLYIDLSVWSLQEHFRRCSSWLAVLIASLRLLIIKKVSVNKQGKWSKPSTGWTLIFIVFCLSGVLSAFYQTRNLIVENRVIPLPANCAEYQDLKSRPPFSVVLSPLFSFENQLVLRIYSMFDAIVTKFLPCTTFPILTIFLIRNLRNIQNPVASKGRKASVANEEKKDLTTKLIVFMTISFFIAEAPLGIIYAVKVFYDLDDQVFLISLDIKIYFTTLLTINSISHSTLCIFMSSQYRDSIRRMFGIQKKPKLSVARNKTSVISGQRIRAA